MRGLRATIGITCLAGAGIASLLLVECAQPTQIVIEVYSDACPGTKAQAINQTGIAVGHADAIDNKPPSALQNGCERAPGVGTLTIYPSGNNDEEVAIKVVAGVDTKPDLCLAPGYAGCIAHRRVTRFVPHTTQRVIVRLSLACLNRTCATGKTCDNGVCKDERDLLPDGGTRPDAETQEAGSSVDAGVVDAAPVDPCTGCKGDCTNGTTCNVNCDTVACGTGNLCAPTLPCSITCPKTGKCNDITCTTSAKCSVRCGTEATSCGQVTCNAGECDVHCDGTDSCNGDGGIRLDAGTKGKLSCKGDNACNFASCNAQTCQLSCDPLNGSNSACPDVASRPCTPTTACADWINPSGP